MQTRARATIEKGDRPRLLTAAGRFALAFILSDAALLGAIRPFGVCYALTLAGSDRYVAALGACLGSLMIYGRAGAPYAASCVVALACDRFVLKTREARELFLPPLLAATVCVVRGPFALADGPGGLLMLLAEGAAALAASFCLLHGGELRRGALEALLLAALAPLKLFGLLTPAAAAAAVLAMSAVREGAHGGARSLAFGSIVDLACVRLSCAPAFAVSAALTAAFPGAGRALFALLWLAASTAVLLAAGGADAIGAVCDCFLAATVFLLLPARGDGREAPPLPPEQTPGGLTRLSRALHALSNAAAPDGEPEEDIAAVFDDAVGDVCRDCPRRERCWIDTYVDTAAWLDALRPALRERGLVRTRDMEAPFAAACARKERLCGALNRSYGAYLRRRAAGRRERERARLLQSQLEGLSAAAQGLAEAAAREHRPRPLLEKKLNEVLRAYGRGLRAEVWSGRGGLTLRVGPFEQPALWIDESAFLRTAEGLTGASFLPAECVPYGGCEVLVYRERESLRAVVDSAVRKKPGEEVCGDAYLTFRTDDGRLLVLLSDGMGSGREAARLARNTLELTAAFLRSGCAAGESAAAVLPFLRARYGAEGFATLDLLELDLFTGACTMIKCGAADSFVVRGARAERLSKRSLPPGAGGTAPEALSFFLREGDALIMASDGADLGALTEGPCREPAARELLTRFGAESRDDLTVLVVTVGRS